MAIDLEKLDQKFSNKFGGIASAISKGSKIDANHGVTNIIQFVAFAYEKLFNFLLGSLALILIPVSYFFLRYSRWTSDLFTDNSWYEDLGLGILTFLLVCFFLVLVFGVFATFISINSYLRQISQNTAIADEQQFKVIISCPSCNQKTRVPANKELEITCPSCKNEWVEKT